jgi:hypothetical protein
MFRAKAPTEAPFDENLSAARRRKRRTKLGASRLLPWTSVCHKRRRPFVSLSARFVGRAT